MSSEYLSIFYVLLPLTNFVQELGVCGYLLLMFGLLGFRVLQLAGLIGG